MWGANAAAPLNTVQFGYGVGAVFVNLLVRPFLEKKIPSMDSTSSSNTETETKANIFIPYTITAVLCIIIALGHLFFYIRALKIRKETLEVHEVLRNCQRNYSIFNEIFRLIMLLLVQVRRLRFLQ